MKQDTKRFSSIIIAALIIAAAIVVYFELIVPAYANLQDLKGQESGELTVLSNEQQIVTQIQSLLTTYQNNSSSSQLVQLALPVGEDVSGALAQIYGIAVNSDVTIQSAGVSIQAVQSPVTSGSVASGSVATAAANGSIVKPTGTISFTINGTGSYESFKAFLQGLETNIRLFNVTAISLMPGTVSATKTQAANQDMFSYSMTIVTYYQAS